jgi:hypothetical protein
VVGFWCLAGVLVMLVLAARWPGPQFFADAIAAAEAANTGAAAAAPVEVPVQGGNGARIARSRVAPEAAGGASTL